MEVVKEQLEGNKVELKIEVEPARVNKALDQAYHKVVKEVAIPGFRKGKVPRKVLEARYGKEILYKDAFDFLVPQAYAEAVKEAELEPIAQPEITDFHIAQDEPATFTAIVEVKPEVKLGEYKGLGIKKEEVEVTEEDINTELEKLQNQHSQLESTEREVIEKGDFAVIDFEGFVEGKAFPGGSAEEYTLEIGSGTFIPGFEEQLVAKKVGEELDVEVSFPEDYHAKDLAGKDAVFKVKIKEIKVKNIPELNDDFAKEVSEFETLEELKADIKEKILKHKEEDAQIAFEDELVEAVSDNVEVDVPQVLIDNELDAMYQNMAYSLQLQGLKIEQYLQYLGMDEKQWRETNKEVASKRAKINLVLEAIAQKEGIEVSDEEIDERIEEMAKNSEQSLEQIKVYLQLNGQLDGIKHSLLIKKVFKYLEENN